ncbi:hypothetical protein WJX73_001279 [Symbiochloris irregularis]|uniref:Beta-galactosidase n=1 Tax=Symbiochloris irregularis TaxID=706552 RepID=A0AAW1NTR2_9CHLO
MWCQWEGGTFTIEDNRFIKDGEPFRILSGSIHYQRMHPAYWRDRLLRVKSLGANTIETYVPWNIHEPRPREYNFQGLMDVFHFLELCQEVGLNVLLRPGPYICAEFEFGGLPWWLEASNEVKGGGTMLVRSSDPLFLDQVDAWWEVLLPRLRKFLYTNGGPVLMVQIENEFGFCGRKDPVYLRHLVNLVRKHLGREVTIYTTDPPYATPIGTLPGSEVFTVVDFGPGTNVDMAFAAQALQNVPGKSPALCSEFYTGWITHWGEPMANTSAAVMIRTLDQILSYGNDTGSVNLYMAYGGSNFGYWAGANLAGNVYQPTITSYDYDGPISEAGASGQPGIGGPSKFDLIRAVFAKHSGLVPPAPQLPIPAQSHPKITLKWSVPLLGALDKLSHPKKGISAKRPDTMEQYGQAGGFILYRTHVPATALAAEEGASLSLGAPVHDYATVLVGGKEAGVFERNNPRNLTLTTLRLDGGAAQDSTVVLDILVHALGRVNFGCVWDFKGLTSPTVLLDGEELENWTVYPLPIEPLPGNRTQGLGVELFHASEIEGSHLAHLPGTDAHLEDDVAAGPAFFAGVLNVSESSGKGPSGHPLDTFMDLRGWTKGLVFVNGFNLGWYWPVKGPQNTQYIPGPLLHFGPNEVVLLEVEPSKVQDPSVEFTATPNFFGPDGKGAPAETDLWATGSSWEYQRTWSYNP